ncbi:LysR substrate-binding domain-containing protein [Paracoccus sp. SCSIO 75233]|uniref:LysR substrate-binding domain-containing protein n=1 Tax=Paracoccus sp. SCSIO 75233 TaxID=3017782 RepID=UPI0022EFED29|nr:LysR substrate-binding domain-containing protein [Paracoccus sp. SCSIO 75233]WBU53065.1 LysR substrate-binding domain-containing protein [Paracoccus sp. SCSIO 75233]
MRRRIPSLSALTSFEAAARHESFTLAAEELGVTQGAVNRQVRDLERTLGITLLRREGRAIRLTDAGSRLANELGDDLMNLDRTIERAITSGEQKAHISIGAPPTFAARWLVPRLPIYLEKHPDTAISIRSYTDRFNLQEERVDLAIHYGMADWPGGQLQKLCPEDVVAVVSSDLARDRNLSSASDLDHLPSLHLSSRPEQWNEFRAAHGLAGPVPGPRLLFDQFAMIIAGAVSGLGAGLVPSYLIETELTNGSLQVIAPLPDTTSAQYHLVTPAGQNAEAVSKLSAWLRREARQSQLQRRATSAIKTAGILPEFSDDGAD